MVVLDTNILIDHLRTAKTKPSLLEGAIKERKEETFGISIITVQELFEGKSTRDENEKVRVMSILGHLKVLPYNLEVAQMAGEIARDLRRTIALADAAIAATTILNSASLLTLDKEDFKGINSLALLAE